MSGPRAGTLSRQSIYIDGRWLDRSRAARIAVIDPTTEEGVAEIPAGTEEDVDAAVVAASRAGDAWGALGFAKRAPYIAAVADGLERRREELVELIVTEVGTPRRAAEVMQVDVALQTFRDIATLAGKWEEEERVVNSAIVRMPIGVAGLITPWNYPLYQIALKVAPALAAGCSVVLKPSEVAPLNAFALADALHEAGLPPGVFNLVPGTGADVGEAIVRHPGVDMISFTGSVRAGKRVAALAGEGVKKVALELGGKGASVILEGADVNAAVTHCVRSCFSNAGQTCAALTRLIVSRTDLARVEEAARSSAAAYVVGDPRNPETQLGPVVSEQQRDRVRSFIAQGEKEGARMLIGPADRTLPAKGYFIAPTIFSDVMPQMTIAQQEIFGPVLSIIPVENESDAVAAANSTRYGLTAAVWAADLNQARKVAAHIHAGSITLNGGKFNPSAPFGGFKQSGFGRERGRFGVEEYLALKAYHA